jgi:hypothetical protein
VEKTRARIIAASGDQAAVMETVINEAEELVEQERAKYEDILLTESAKHKQVSFGLVANDTAVAYRPMRHRCSRRG